VRRPRFHLVPGDAGWELRKVVDVNGKPTKRHWRVFWLRTKAAALATARGYCRLRYCQLIVWSKDTGRIMFEHTYPRGSDPRPKLGDPRNRG